MGIQKIIAEGTRFGRLVVVAIEEGWVRRIRYVCRCDCGELSSVAGVKLRFGNTKSCGCGKMESRKLSRKEGMSENGHHTPEYESYRGMLKRCFNSNGQDFKDYGGRGISIHKDWVGNGGFQRFLAHMGKRPTSKHSIDRVDVNGNYEPTNVRWVTSAVQSRNKRNSWSVFVSGQWMNAKDAAPILGMAYSSLVNACRGAQGFPRGFEAPQFKRGA